MLKVFTKVLAETTGRVKPMFYSALLPFDMLHECALQRAYFIDCVARFYAETRTDHISQEDQRLCSVQPVSQLIVPTKETSPFNCGADGDTLSMENDDNSGSELFCDDSSIRGQRRELSLIDFNI